MGGDGIDLSGLARGVELKPIQLWRDPMTRNVIIQVLPGEEQAVFTPAQWEKAKAFLDTPQPDEVVLADEEPEAKS